MAVECGQLYCTSGNIGDDFQARASSLHLPEKPTRFINRDRIHEWRSEEQVALIMNGWFASNRDAWPPAAMIHPIFVGFHISERFKPTVRRHSEYLRRYAPIGARDVATAKFLESLGVAAELTHCLTLTFPTREKAPRDGKVYIVDGETISIPKSLRKGAVKITHLMPPLDYTVTLPMADELLQLYRDTARLVITTRLHSALPCIAMGIPVVYFSRPKDGRTSVVQAIGGTIYDQRLHSKSLTRGVFGRLFDKVDWSPPTLDVTGVKSHLTSAVARRLNALPATTK